MKENILRTNLIKIFIIISLFISGCTDMGMMSEDAEKAFNEASVSEDSEKLTESGISFASGDTATSVTSDFSLATSGDEGSTISWTSSNTGIITVNEDGSTTVTRPSGSNAVVILTATVSKGSVTSTKTFTVTVLAADVVFHTITFNANSGSGSMSDQTVAEGAAANLTANAFTRTGYTFAGWDENSDGVADYADGASYTMGTSDVSLYAVWTAIPTHTITFNANGGSGSMSSQTVAEGATANLTANAFTRTGYTFAGWDDGSDGAADYADGESYTMGSSNVSLDAVWTAITHSITFNANGGSGSMSSQTIAEGAAANLTANGFTRTGYTFAGWDEDSDGAADYADGASYTMGSSNVTLYAVWRANLSISSITPDGETSVSSDTDIKIVFSDSLDGTTKGTVSFASPAVTFTDGGNATITFSTTTKINDTITINPDANLQATNHTSITVSGFRDTYSRDVNCSDSGYYFPVRGAMDLYFPFTNGSLTDASGRGVLLERRGDPTLTTGHDGSADGAYIFDGAGDYMQVIGDLGISAGDDFTISAWIKLDPGFLNFNAIVSNYHDNALNALMFRVNSSWEGHTNALDLAQGYSNNGVLSTGTWLHVVGVYINASRQVRFYVNGSAAGTGTTPYTIEDQTTQFAIGGDYLNVSPRYFKGTIDEVRFYKYALTSTEVNNLYDHDDID